MWVPNECVLGGKEDKTMAHLFVNCEYSRQVWEAFMNRSDDVRWALMGTTVGTIADVQIGDLIEGIESFPWMSPCWGLHWVALAAFVWHLWGEGEETTDLWRMKKSQQ